MGVLTNHMRVLPIYVLKRHFADPIVLAKYCTGNMKRGLLFLRRLKSIHQRCKLHQAEVTVYMSGKLQSFPLILGVLPYSTISRKILSEPIRQVYVEMHVTYIRLRMNTAPQELCARWLAQYCYFSVHC